jgi:hypothetical protein
MGGRRWANFEEYLAWFFTQRPDKWEQHFFANFVNEENPLLQKAAKEAWRKLQQVGLDNIAEQLLWEYATCKSPVAEIRSGIRHMDHNLKARSRAVRVAKERSSGPRAARFEKRLKDATMIAAQTEWPFHNPNLKTWGDAASAYPVIADLPLSHAGNPKAGDALRRYGGKFFLAILRVGARAHGVHLSPYALAVLAWCARSDTLLDERALRRFLKLKAIQFAEPGYLRLFEAQLYRFRPR